MARRRYQKGSIRKRGARNPVWELQWWADFLITDGTIGRKRESTILGIVSEMTKRQAQKAAEEHLRALNLGKITPLSTQTFREFVETHFVPNVFPVLKNSTRKNYRVTLNNHLLPAFGDRRLCDITTLEIQRFVLQKAESGLGWESLDRFRNLMSRIFVTAKKWGHFSGENPASGIELPEKTPVREKHALTPEQIHDLLGCLREPVRSMVLVGILTGMRVGEILALRRKDIDVDRQEIRVEQACYRGSVGTPKTKGSRRTLPVPEELISVLTRFCRHSGGESDSDFAFHTNNGTPFSDTNLLHRDLKPAGQKIGAPWLSWHTLRRTHATLLQAAGGSLKDAQAQLGHSKLSTTLELYTMPQPRHQRQAVENLWQLVTNGDEKGQFARRLPVLTQQIQ